MTAVPPPQQQQPGQQPQQSPGMQGAQPQQPAPQQAQPLPPTGLQQQLASLQQQYQAAGTGPGGFNPAQQQFQQAAAAGAQLPAPVQGQSNLNSLAQRLAQSYGLNIGRGNLVDEAGNFLMTPDQIAQASGGQETLGTAATKMQFIADAIQRQQTEQQQEKARASLETGLGQVQSRARGSLAAMQSPYFRDLANLYAGNEYESADFSYFVEKEKQDIQMEMMRRAEQQAKKRARVGFGLGVLGLIAAPFTGGATLPGAVQGLAGVSETGWF